MAADSVVRLDMTNNTASSDDQGLPPETGPQRSVFRSLAIGLTLLGAIAIRGAVASPPSSAHLATSDSGAAQDVPPASPVAMPPPASFLWRVYLAAERHRVMLMAAGVTFYALLALFPAIGALVTLFGLFADPEMIKQQLSSGQDVLPEGAIEIIGDQISRIQASGGGALGFAFFINLAISLWSANAGIKGLFDALNAVHGTAEKRSFLAYNLQALAFTLGTIVFVMLAVGAIIVLPAIFAFLGLQDHAGSTISLLRWPLLLVCTLLFLSLLYRFGPTPDHPRWRLISWGTITATVVWLAGSMLFSWYVGSFGTFNRTYGSLGAVIGFMFWIWISAMIVLLGAEIDAELNGERQPARTSR